MEKLPTVIIPVLHPFPYEKTSNRSPLPRSRNAEKLKELHINPILITKNISTEEQDILYEQASGILLPGGLDVDPLVYHQVRHPSVQLTDATLDTLSLRFIYRALADNKPVLGVCRGAQLMALASGGTLIQHLPDVTEEEHGVSIEKRDTVYPSSIFHDVLIKPQTKTHEIFKTAKLNVPSRHHQAVDNPGELIVSGRSPSGIVEIVEHPDQQFHIGLQTHPELVNNLDAIFIAYKHAVEIYQLENNTAKAS